MSFLCPRCGRTSYHPEDEKEGYCGACHDYTALKAGDVLRIRHWGSDDLWCICAVQLASTNGQSLALRVVEGALRTANGGLMTGAIAVNIDPQQGTVTEVLTGTELVVEGRV
jgi:hypothetical protein